MEVPKADNNSSQGVKRRMPPEIKQKLARVARMAHAIHGKLSKELLNRLMSILGHLIQIRSLKRNLHNMVTMGLSAKEEKDTRIQQLKKEVENMVKTRAPMMKPEAIEQQAGSSDDFQETGGKEKAAKSIFITDDALEDKICEAYYLLVEGLDDDAGHQARKLYAELADLFPKGCMDNRGIKEAICRSKDRRKALYRSKDQEKLKRKKMLVSKSETISGEPGSMGLVQHASDKLAIATDSTAPMQSITTTLATNTPTRPPNSANIPATDRQKHEKLKGTSSNQTDTSPWEMVKKKAKKKPEPEPEHSDDKRKAYKQMTSSTLVKTTTLESATPALESVIPAQPTVNRAADMD